MSFHIDTTQILFDELVRRIKATDLVPSRMLLLDDIDQKMKVLKMHGVTTVSDLRQQIKNAKQIDIVSNKTGIDARYLNLLRREVESYFAKPIKLKAFSWIAEAELSKLANGKIDNTAKLLDAAKNNFKQQELLDATGIKKKTLDELLKLSALTRIQWVNHNMARMLVLSGYDSLEKIIGANPETLCENLNVISKTYNFYQESIGLRDIKRLITAAKYLIDWDALQRK